MGRKIIYSMGHFVYFTISTLKERFSNLHEAQRGFQMFNQGTFLPYLFLQWYEYYKVEFSLAESTIFFLCWPGALFALFFSNIRNAFFTHNSFFLWWSKPPFSCFSFTSKISGVFYVRGCNFSRLRAQNRISHIFSSFKGRKTVFFLPETIYFALPFYNQTIKTALFCT